jgi:hypothetical protein
MRRAIQVCRDRIEMAEWIGWPALAASWRKTLADELARGHKDPTRKGPYGPHPQRLTDDDVIEIRACREPYASIAGRYGISEGYVSNLKQRHRRAGARPPLAEKVAA